MGNSKRIKNLSLEDIETQDIFGLNEEQRKEIIKASVQVYIQQVELGTLLIDADFLTFLQQNIIHTENEIERLTDEEEYEVCFFLQEIISEVKKEYNGLLV